MTVFIPQNLYKNCENNITTLTGFTLLFYNENVHHNILAGFDFTMLFCNKTAEHSILA